MSKYSTSKIIIDLFFFELLDRLINSGHFSPTEHVAVASIEVNKGGNLGPGWTQYRKTLSGEYKTECLN